VAERASPPPSPKYLIPSARHRAELVIDRSRFICTLAPAPGIDEAQAFIREIQREFPDATHNCWAYLVGAPGSSDRIGLSDDGEPHGTAGRPMFTVLQHAGVGDIVAVVTRYFGGVKLGTGGLVKAYSGAVQHALESLPRVLRVTRTALIVRVHYAAVTAIQQLWASFDAEVTHEQFAVDVQFHVRCPDDQVDALRRAVLDATRGQGQVELDRSAPAPGALH